jgi:DNA transformation protein
VFCAIVAHDTLYFKVDDSNRPDYEAYGAGPFKPFERKQMVMSYYEVPAQVIDDRWQMVEWGRKAIEAARRSGTKPRTSRGKPTAGIRPHKATR